MFDRDCPPSTEMHAPLRRLACCEQTNATTPATSSTCPNRPSGISARTNAAIASGSACCRRCQPPPSHRIEPGATQLTVTPFDATSLASDLTKLISAALAALYAGAPPDSRPQTEEMTTTRPQPRVSMPGSTSCVMRALTTTLPANADSNSDGPVSAHELPARTPRLLMRMSTDPSTFSVSLNARRHPDSVSRSATTPRPPTDCAVRLTSASVRAATDTRTPSAASACAMPSPMPFVPAVTIATLPEMSRSIEDRILLAGLVRGPHELTALAFEFVGF